MSEPTPQPTPDQQAPPPAEPEQQTEGESVSLTHRDADESLSVPEDHASKYTHGGWTAEAEQ